MKQIKTFLAAACLFLLATGCDTTETSTTATPSASGNSDLVQLEKGKPSSHGKFTFTLNEVKEQQVMKPDGKIVKGIAAELSIDDGEGKWITNLLQGMSETVYEAYEAGEQDITYEVVAVDEAGQTAQLRKKLGEPIE